MILKKIVNKIYPFLIPEEKKQPIKDLIALDSFTKLIKTPYKWVILNKNDVAKILIAHLLYLFSNSRIKWIDHNIIGQLAFREGKLLYKIAKKIPQNGCFVELGALIGRSTCFIAEGLKNKDAIFYSIDPFIYAPDYIPFNRVFRLYCENTYRYKDKIKNIRGYSYNVVKDLNDLKIDVLWHDADHSYEGVKKDIEDWIPLLKKTGYFVFHDYKKPELGVYKAVDEKIRENKLRKVKAVHTILVTKK